MCDREENRLRIVSSGRAASGKGKLQDVDILDDIRNRCDLLKFGSAAEIHLDVTYLSPTRAAEKLLDGCDLARRYPRPT